MNQDYHMFFQMHGWHDSNCWALHSAAFYFLATTRALWEEYTHVHKHAHEPELWQAWADYKIDSFPKFILELAATLDPVR